MNGYLTANGNTAAGSAVVEDALHDNSEWIRSKDVSGYFTLRNGNCGKYLTGQSSGTPNFFTIEGNDDSFFIQLSYIMLVILLIDQNTQVEEQTLDNSIGQMWKIVPVDPYDCGWWGCYYNVSDFFNLINPASGKLLTALAAFDLRVLGIK